MPRIVLARDLQHEQIEFPEGTPFPEARRNGGSGALHLRRGSMRDVTPEELAYIREHRPEVFRCLDVLPEPKRSAALARKLASLERQKAREAAAAKAEGSKPADASEKPEKPSRRTRKPKPDAG